MRRCALWFTVAAAAFLPPLAAQGLTLDDAVSIAKARSLSMEDPQISRMQVKGQVEEAWSNALPQVEGQIGYQRAFKANKIFFPNPETGEYMALKMQQDNAMSADLTMTQPLLTFGRVAAGLRGAHAAYRASDHQGANTEKAVELETMKRFWSVLLTREVMEARRASAAVSDSSLSRAQRMRDVGLMSDYDVLRVNVQAMNQRPPLREAENNVRLAELALNEWLGVPIDTTITVEGRMQDYTLPLDTLNAPAGVLHRDDIEALRDLSTMRRNIYIIYRNAHWPTLGGQLAYSWTWQNDQWDITPRNNVSSLYGGVALNIPIWTSGGQHGQAERFKADWRRAELDIRMAERSARLQYESAIRNYHTALESEEASRVTVDQAEKARTIAQTKFSQGQLTPLEMDAVQLDELVAKVALAQAEYARLVASAEARLAAGFAPYAK